jgi:hypothetical protein
LNDCSIGLLSGLLENRTEMLQRRLEASEESRKQLLRLMNTEAVALKNSRVLNHDSIPNRNVRPGSGCVQIVTPTFCYLDVDRS